MKRSVLWIVALVLLLAAAALAPVFKTDPGHVLINFGDWTVETSVLVLLITVIAIWLLVYTIIWLWRLPGRAARKVKEQRSVKQLEKGLLALTEGDWQTAEKALQKSANAQGRTTVQYLAAARAAQGQDAEARRELYLEQADTRSAKQRFLVTLAKAKMLVGNGDTIAAIPLLEDLRRRRKRHPQVLELLSRCYRERKEWQSLRAIMPDLKKAGVLDDSQVLDLQRTAATHELESSLDSDSLQSVWKRLPKDVKWDASCIAAFADRARGLDQSTLAEPVLRTGLKQVWDAGLVLRYGDPGAEDIGKRMNQCEKWLNSHPKDANLHLALGRLCAGESLWGKAKQHLITSLELEPSSLGYESLGQVFEVHGDIEPAMACFRNALRVNQGEPPLPLPGDQARLQSPAAVDQSA